jgi:putative ABC transport system ATP-binding protein
LSVGEQQCVAVARAIAKNAELLLCDEPTAALDSDMAKTVIDLLYETCKTAGKTILLVTGDVYAAEKADRVVRLKDGCVIENTENN